MPNEKQANMTKKTRKAQTISEKMIKVDHTGENGAVNIYRAQYLAASLRAPQLKPQLRHFQQHEEEHREIFRQYLDKNGLRRCMSYHLSGIGGFALGFTTGLIGPNAIAATTYAVENVVLEHLEHQIEFLKDDNTEAFTAVSMIYEDEKSHHDTAKAQLSQQTWMARIIVKLVKLSTEAVIAFGMR